MGWALLVKGLSMKTFEAGGDVRPIEQILDGTLHVQALRAWLGRALDDLLTVTAERDDLRAKLDAANVELHELRIRAGLAAGLEAQVGELREMLAARGAAMGLGRP